MNARFYAPDARATGDEVRLPDDEAQHLTRVLRLGTGDQVCVLDGRGHEFDAVVVEALKSRVTVRLGESREPAPEPRVAITLAQAVLKGDKMDQVVRDAVMVGAAAIQPIVTARTEVGLAALTRANRRERWERIAISSAKQCGRAVVPPVFEPLDAAAVLEKGAATDLTLLFAEPSAGNATPLTSLEATPPASATIVVGPEGGWTPEELRRARRCRFVRLGSRTIRADAMGILAMAALFAYWREY
jgi:16S rRNA (uracil1498-N3)-methyltransferase